MIHCLRNIRTVSSLQSKISYNLGGGNKRKKTSGDLENYDVLFVGANLGGICSNHFDKDTHGKYKCFVSFDQPINQIYSVRIPYEQQRVRKSEYIHFSKKSINQFTPSEMSAVKEILPEQNAVILSNGRRIGYNQLVLATGLKHDFSQIKGFYEALENPEHPVYSNKDPESWRSAQHKYSKYISNFKSGDGYFCIPEYPYAGEVECFNFFVSDEVWKWAQHHGALSPKHTFTIVNANEKFVHYCDSADAFIKERLEKRGIRVEYNTKLLEVHQDGQKATFINTKTGEKSVRDYNNLYSIVPSKRQEFLDKAGLTNSNGLLNVDHQTLQHKKYKNIFGLGDAADLPTTKTFWAGWYQIAVVRNNVRRNLQGQTLNAHYDGFSKVPLFTGHQTLTYIAHSYGGVGNWQHLKHNNGGIIAWMRYRSWAKGMAKKFSDFYNGSRLGPPYHKKLVTFPELPGSPESQQSSGVSKYFPTKTENKVAH
ncbi:hypothetical protein ABPG72_003613 [Tetrahymena utriculariae]